MIVPMRACLLVILLASAGFGQAPPKPQAPAPEEVKAEDKCSIEGRAVNASTGEPLRKTSISMHRTDPGTFNSGYGTMTDAAGNFQMRDLDPGHYFLSASRNGFVRLDYGAKGPNRPGTLLTLAPAQKLTGILFKLVPQSVVTGRIQDVDNEPVANVSVQLMQHQFQKGKRELVSSGFSQTNDLGEYRIFGVAPGRYYLNATYRSQGDFGTTDKSANPSQVEGYPPLYYPGVPDASSAVALDVPAGGELRGINMTMRQARAVKIRGKVSGFPADQFGMVMLTRKSPTRGMFISPVIAGINQKNNSFELKGVTPGTYYLTVMGMANDREHLTGRLQVEVGSEDIEGANLALTPGFTVKGVVKVEGGELDRTTLHVQTQPTEMNMSGSGFATAAVNADGTFALPGMSPENVTFGLNGLKDNAFLKSTRAGDQEVTDQVDLGGLGNAGIELLVSLAGGEIEGDVKGAGSKPLAGVTALLVPDTEHAAVEGWYHAATTDQNGHYKMPSIRPGKYTLYAFEDIEPGAYMEPGFLKPFEKSAKELEIKEKAHQTVPLEVIPASAMAGLQE
jgi:protocatechuate 3,4-dioxygenase beta subunit